MCVCVAPGYCGSLLLASVYFPTTACRGAKTVTCSSAARTPHKQLSASYSTDGPRLTSIAPHQVRCADTASALSANIISQPVTQANIVDHPPNSINLLGCWGHMNLHHVTNAIIGVAV